MDKFYTKPEIARKCCEIILKHKLINAEKDLIIEPSAGAGSFIGPIKNVLRAKHSIFYDIAPAHKKIKKQNFLTLIPYTKRRVHIVGNPPFGFRGSLAIKFIKKASTFCDTFSFILPRSFKKPSMKKSVPSNFCLICTHMLPKYSFIKDGLPYDVPCVFQIWKKSKGQKYIMKTLRPVGYTFARTGLNADFAVRRVGFNAGKISQYNLEVLNKNTHYFVKLNDTYDLEKIKDIESRSKKDVAGPYSISKREIIRKLNIFLCK
ncbi:hypothetical protein [Flavobacterium sp.]|jgi:predicted RNA methylase|uniref:hypothetical protein n=1 Tax=Flavobacterium sp. TaxID=239 RepID=UPI0037C05071